MIRTQGCGLLQGHDSCQVQGHLLRSVPVRDLCLQPKEAEAQRCQGICPGHSRSWLAGVSANHILRLQREPHQVQNGNQVLRRDAWFREDFKLEDNVMWLPQELPRNFSYSDEPLPVPGRPLSLRAARPGHVCRAGLSLGCWVLRNPWAKLEVRCLQGLNTLTPRNGQEWGIWPAPGTGDPEEPQASEITRAPTKQK